MKANKIGIVIKELLEEVDGICGVFALVAPLKTSFPFVVYGRSSVTPTYTKRPFKVSDFDTVNVEVQVVHSTYEGSIEAMERVHDAIQGKSGVFGDIEVKSIKLIDSTEDFESDVYIQNHTYELIIY